jgi:hypothetical protein
MAGAIAELRRAPGQRLTRATPSLSFPNRRRSFRIRRKDLRFAYMRFRRQNEVIRDAAEAFRTRPMTSDLQT